MACSVVFYHVAYHMIKKNKNKYDIRKFAESFESCPCEAYLCVVVLLFPDGDCSEITVTQLETPFKKFCNGFSLSPLPFGLLRIKNDRRNLKDASYRNLAALWEQFNDENKGFEGELTFWSSTTGSIVTRRNRSDAGPREGAHLFRWRGLFFSVGSLFQLCKG